MADFVTHFTPPIGGSGRLPRSPRFRLPLSQLAFLLAERVWPWGIWRRSLAGMCRRPHDRLRHLIRRGEALHIRCNKSAKGKRGHF